MEIWRKIGDYDNYSVSNQGNVRNDQTNRVLKNHLDKCNYHVVYLSKNNKAKTVKVHRLVANAFINNPEEKPYVDHIDNNRINNDVVNLRYCTPQENIRNSKLNDKNTSGYKGVSLNKLTNKWESYITVDRIKVHLGYYDNADDAKQARIRKVNQVFGEYKNACEN
jgi:hypothetical protein